MAKKKILVSVTNDISNDLRVHKQCTTLDNMRFEVLVIGRKRKDSVKLKRNYNTYRFGLLFNKGPLFYAEYNFRLFFYLLFRKSDVLLANDLDTLLANYLISKLKSIPIVYDSHEYYTEVPELVGRSFAKNCWIRIEKMCVPHVRYMYTVNESIAKLYRDKFKRDVGVIRNIPPYIEAGSENIQTHKEQLNLPADKKLLIIQGTGINIDRGVEEVVEAMQYVDQALLLIIGSGDVIPSLRQRVNELNVNNKVKFISKIPFNELAKYTRVCDVGLTVDKDTNLNYRYSLPNKLFNYIQAGIAVLASNLVEVTKIINDYQVGIILENHQPQYIAKKINELIADEKQLSQYKSNSRAASKELNWENEEPILKKIFSEFS